MKKVFICGLTASGKGLMRVLLDGHPELIAYPVQGLGMRILSKDFETFILRKRRRSLVDSVRLFNEQTKRVTFTVGGETVEVRISELLHYLVCESGGFHQLIDNSINGAIRAGRTQREEVFVDFSLDYSKVLRRIEDTLLDRERLNSTDELLDIVYFSVVQEWTNLTKPVAVESQFVMVTPNRIQQIKNILERSRESKVIVMWRDPVDRTYTNAKNMQTWSYRQDSHAVDSDLRLHSNSLWLSYDSSLYGNAFLDQMSEFRILVKKMTEMHGKIHVVEFEQLIRNREEITDGIADFLGIEKNECMLRASLNSTPLEGGKLEFSGKIADDSSKALSLVQKQFIQYLSKGEVNRMSVSRKVSFFLLDTPIGRLVAKVLTLLVGNHVAPKQQ